MATHTLSACSTAGTVLKGSLGKGFFGIYHTCMYEMLRNPKEYCQTYSTLQIQGIKRFACQTRLLQTQNACKRCAKRVYYKRKTRVNAVQNACKRGAKRV